MAPNNGGVDVTKMLEKSGGMTKNSFQKFV